jgi:hypothetical protein
MLRRRAMQRRHPEGLPLGTEYGAKIAQACGEHYVAAVAAPGVRASITYGAPSSPTWSPRPDENQAVVIEAVDTKDGWIVGASRRVDVSWVLFIWIR